MNPTYQTVLTNSNSLPSQNFKLMRTAKSIKKSTDSKTRVKFHAHFPPGRNKTLARSFSYINKPTTVYFPPSSVVKRKFIGNICSFIPSKCSQLCNLIRNSKEITPNSGMGTILGLVCWLLAELLPANKCRATVNVV